MFFSDWKQLFWRFKEYIDLFDILDWSTVWTKHATNNGPQANWNLIKAVIVGNLCLFYTWEKSIEDCLIREETLAKCNEDRRLPLNG